MTTATKPEIPRFATVTEALDHLAAQGDHAAQAAYLELLGITGCRDECEVCVVANYIFAATGIFVSVIPGYGPDLGVVETGERQLRLPDSTNRLAVRFDNFEFPNLTDPCPKCHGPHEHGHRDCCGVRTCSRHLRGCPLGPVGAVDWERKY